MAVNQSITKKFTPNYKEVNYLAKTFPEFRQNLIEFAKSYYPNTYNDFNEASPGMMFIEMAAYVGDVLSFYVDNAFKENLLSVAQESRNVILIAQSLGYRPRLSAPATVSAIIYQMVPPLGSANNYDPDQRFFLKILANSRFSTNIPPKKIFQSIEDVDFSDPTDRTIEILARDNNGVPTMYVASKRIQLIAAERKTTTFTFGSAQKFTRVELPDNNVIAIENVTDLDDNVWTEVDYLGQDLIIEEREIKPRNSAGTLEESSIPIESVLPSKLIMFKRKPRRFVTRITPELKMEMWFGSGVANATDEQFFLNATQIANTKYDQTISNTPLDPSDFIESDTFGLAPANTTLTVNYLTGGGIDSNVASNTITVIDNLNVSNVATDYAPEQQNLFTQIVGSVAINNEEPATGGGSTETLEEIRQNALTFFNAQNRVVTDKDYLVRTLAMPTKFGSVAKAFVVRDEQLNTIQRQDAGTLSVNVDVDPTNNIEYVNNPVAPNAINLYVIGYNAEKRLATLNSLVKQNLAKYLEQFRILTDDVNILDAFVVNIGVNFEIIVYRNYNMNDVLARCIDAIKDFFNIDKWQINQPIILNDLRLTIGSVDGVQSLTNLVVNNKYKFKDGKDYQEYRYPISDATIDDVIYPSLDPCIFEIRYPETDIIGHAKQ